eukprot:gnl/Chilomastix_cuspidata/4916.p1 GENE.gnl/Chilomastix_cuspidata/4916~~gnl/Chilomastix_cuspidata/4916.p1  ORF type:complete len:3201 (+),score=1038.95 gnl/Chilomastix_cuspidata/4916:87-9605(+)
MSLLLLVTEGTTFLNEANNQLQKCITSLIAIQTTLREIAANPAGLANILYAINNVFQFQKPVSSRTSFSCLPSKDDCSEHIFALETIAVCAANFNARFLSVLRSTKRRPGVPNAAPGWEYIFKQQPSKARAKAALHLSVFCHPPKINLATIAAAPLPDTRAQIAVRCETFPSFARLVEGVGFLRSLFLADTHFALLLIAAQRYSEMFRTALAMHPRSVVRADRGLVSEAIETLFGWWERLLQGARGGIAISGERFSRCQCVAAAFLFPTISAFLGMCPDILSQDLKSGRRGGLLYAMRLAISSPLSLSHSFNVSRFFAHLMMLNQLQVPAQPLPSTEELCASIILAHGQAPDAHADPPAPSGRQKKRQKILALGKNSSGTEGNALEDLLSAIPDECFEVCFQFGVANSLAMLGSSIEVAHMLHEKFEYERKFINSLTQKLILNVFSGKSIMPFSSLNEFSVTIAQALISSPDDATRTIILDGFNFRKFVAANKRRRGNAPRPYFSFFFRSNDKIISDEISSASQASWGIFSGGVGEIQKSLVEVFKNLIEEFSMASLPNLVQTIASITAINATLFDQGIISSADISEFQPTWLHSLNIYRVLNQVNQDGVNGSFIKMTNRVMPNPQLTSCCLSPNFLLSKDSRRVFSPAAVAPGFRLLLITSSYLVTQHNVESEPLSQKMLFYNWIAASMGFSEHSHVLGAILTAEHNIPGFVQSKLKSFSLGPEKFDKYLNKDLTRYRLLQSISTSILDAAISEPQLLLSGPILDIQNPLSKAVTSLPMTEISARLSMLCTLVHYSLCIGLTAIIPKDFDERILIDEKETYNFEGIDLDLPGKFGPRSALNASFGFLSSFFSDDNAELWLLDQPWVKALVPLICSVFSTVALFFCFPKFAHGFTILQCALLDEIDDLLIRFWELCQREEFMDYVKTEFASSSKISKSVHEQIFAAFGSFETGCLFMLSSPSHLVVPRVGKCLSSFVELVNIFQTFCPKLRVFSETSYRSLGIELRKLLVVKGEDSKLFEQHVEEKYMHSRVPTDVSLEEEISDNEETEVSFLSTLDETDLDLRQVQSLLMCRLLKRVPAKDTFHAPAAIAWLLCLRCQGRLATKTNRECYALSLALSSQCVPEKITLKFLTTIESHNFSSTLKMSPMCASGFADAEQPPGSFPYPGSPLANFDKKSAQYLLSLSCAVIFKAAGTLVFSPLIQEVFLQSNIKASEKKGDKLFSFSLIPALSFIALDASKQSVESFLPTYNPLHGLSADESHDKSQPPLSKPSSDFIMNLVFKDFTEEDMKLNAYFVASCTPVIYFERIVNLLNWKTDLMLKGEDQFLLIPAERLPRTLVPDNAYPCVDQRRNQEGCLLSAFGFCALLYFILKDCKDKKVFPILSVNKIELVVTKILSILEQVQHTHALKKLSSVRSAATTFTLTEANDFTSDGSHGIAEFEQDALRLCKTHISNSYSNVGFAKTPQIGMTNPNSYFTKQKKDPLFYSLLVCLSQTICETITIDQIDKTSSTIICRRYIKHISSWIDPSLPDNVLIPLLTATKELLEHIPVPISNASYIIRPKNIVTLLLSLLRLQKARAIQCRQKKYIKESEMDQICQGTIDKLIEACSSDSMGIRNKFLAVFSITSVQSLQLASIRTLSSLFEKHLVALEKDTFDTLQITFKERLKKSLVELGFNKLDQKLLLLLSRSSNEYIMKILENTPLAEIQKVSVAIIAVISFLDALIEENKLCMLKQPERIEGPCSLMTDVLEKLIESEILIAESFATLFRYNTFVTKFLSIFFLETDEIVSYRKRILAGPLTEFLLYTDLPKFSIQDFGFKANQKGNNVTVVILSTLSKIVHAIVSNLNAMPSVLKWCCWFVYEKAVSRWGEIAGEVSVSSLLFMRFFIPGIMNPSANKILTAEDMSANASADKCLLLAKIVQTLANFQPFRPDRGEGRYLHVFNDWIAQNSPNIRHYLQSAAKEVVAARGAPVFANPRMKINKEGFEKTWPKNFNQTISTSLKTLRNFTNNFLDAETLMSLSGFLEAEEAFPRAEPPARSLTVLSQGSSSLKAHPFVRKLFSKFSLIRRSSLIKSFSETQDNIAQKFEPIHLEKKVEETPVIRIAFFDIGEALMTGFDEDVILFHIASVFSPSLLSLPESVNSPPQCLFSVPTKCSVLFDFTFDSEYPLPSSFIKHFSFLMSFLFRSSWKLYVLHASHYSFKHILAQIRGDFAKYLKDAYYCAYPSDLETCVPILIEEVSPKAAKLRNSVVLNQEISNFVKNKMYNPASILVTPTNMIVSTKEAHFEKTVPVLRIIPFRRLQSLRITPIDESTALLKLAVFKKNSDKNPTQPVTSYNNLQRALGKKIISKISFIVSSTFAHSLNEFVAELNYTMTMERINSQLKTLVPSEFNQKFPCPPELNPAPFGSLSRRTSFQTPEIDKKPSFSGIENMYEPFAESAADGNENFLKRLFLFCLDSKRSPAVHLHLLINSALFTLYYSSSHTARFEARRLVANICKDEEKKQIILSASVNETSWGVSEALALQFPHLSLQVLLEACFSLGFLIDQKRPITKWLRYTKPWAIRITCKKDIYVIISELVRFLPRMPSFQSFFVDFYKNFPSKVIIIELIDILLEDAQPDERPADRTYSVVSEFDGSEWLHQGLQDRQLGAKISLMILAQKPVLASFISNLISEMLLVYLGVLDARQSQRSSKHQNKAYSKITKQEFVVICDLVLVFLKSNRFHFNYQNFFAVLFALLKLSIIETRGFFELLDSFTENIFSLALEAQRSQELAEISETSSSLTGLYRDLFQNPHGVSAINLGERHSVRKIQTIAAALVRLGLIGVKLLEKKKDQMEFSQMMLMLLKQPFEFPEFFLALSVYFSQVRGSPAPLLDEFLRFSVDFIGAISREKNTAFIPAVAVSLCSTFPRLSSSPRLRASLVLVFLLFSRIPQYRETIVSNLGPTLDILAENWDTFTFDGIPRDVLARCEEALGVTTEFGFGPVFSAFVLEDALRHGVRWDLARLAGVHDPFLHILFEIFDVQYEAPRQPKTSGDVAPLQMELILGALRLLTATASKSVAEATRAQSAVFTRLFLLFEDMLHRADPEAATLPAFTSELVGSVLFEDVIPFSDGLNPLLRVIILLSRLKPSAFTRPVAFGLFAPSFDAAAPCDVLEIVEALSRHLAANRRLLAPRE